MELKQINISKEIKDNITKPIPPYLIQQREGGGKKMLSYLSGNTIIDMLNKAFGYAWSWKVEKEWIEQSIPAVNKYVNGQFCKDSTKWILESQNPVAHVRCSITVFLTANNGTLMPITKEGYGSKSILGKQNDQESIFKAAGTDALKKAASLFGIGLSLYRNEDEQAYFDIENYENPWTDEMLLNHDKLLKDLTSYTDMYKVTAEELQDIVYNATGIDYDILPDNIETVMQFIADSLNIEETK